MTNKKIDKLIEDFIEPGDNLLLEWAGVPEGTK